jgi:hypothetical protein
MCPKIRCDGMKSKNLEFWRHLNNIYPSAASLPCMHDLSLISVFVMLNFDQEKGISIICKICYEQQTSGMQSDFRLSVLLWISSSNKPLVSQVIFSLIIQPGIYTVYTCSVSISFLLSFWLGHFKQGSDSEQIAAMYRNTLEYWLLQSCRPCHCRDGSTANWRPLYPRPCH